MMGLYEQILMRNIKSRHNLATVLDGDTAGEKVLLEEDRSVWQSGTTGFSLEQLQAIRDCRQSEVIIVEGSRIFCECIGGPKTLVICGGGHVSIPMIELGRTLGFRITVLEDRPKFADNARKASAERVICEPFQEGLKQVAGDLDTYFIIVTRGHRYDQVCLEEILKKQNAYVGMMGSKKRVAIVKEQMVEHGIKRELLENVCTPIGLPIGAETPEEIAVSVLAEIIQKKNAKKRISGYSEGLIHEILSEEHGKRILATIVSRKGSAPREIGTKMVIMEDGTTAESIGGGCAESDIMQKAHLMMQEDGRQFQLCQVDMTGKEAEEAGMVCGGVIEVMLEKVNIF